MSPFTPPAASRARIASRCGAITLLVLAACAATNGLHAQSVPPGGQTRDPASGQSAPTQVRLEGQVLDARTGSPLALVSVEIPELRRSTTTDEAGRFRFDRLPAGEHGLRASLVGYRDQSRPVVAASGATVELRMAEDPVLLTGLTVTANRFERRLKAVPYSVRVMGKRELAGSAAPDAAEFVIRRAGLFSARCPRIHQTTCFWIRGSAVQPSVYIDDAPAPGGVDMLAVIPRDEISRVEVIRGGSTIRVYTDRFMVWAARNNYRPLSIGFN